jgi:hypothetical protein
VPRSRQTWPGEKEKKEKVEEEEEEHVQNF